MNNKLTQLVVLAMSLVGMNAATYAEQDQIYLQGMILHQDFDVDADNFGEADKSTGLHGRFGYFITDYLAVELGYLTTKDIDQESRKGDIRSVADIQFEGFTLAAKGILPLTPRVSAYGSLGMFMWDSELDIAVTGADSRPDDFRFPVQSQEFDGTDPIATIGLSFKLSEQSSIALEYGNTGGQWFKEFGKQADFDLNYLGFGLNATF